MKKSNDLEQRRVRLTPEQRKKLAQRIRSNRHTPQQYTLISRRPDAEAAPLSYAQQRHWFLWQLDPQSTAYHLNAAMQLDGELNSSALHASFQTLVQRHEALRTVFRADANGMPEQIIDPEGNFKLLTIDLCDLPQSLWQQRIEHETMKLNTMPFDLTTGPLLRVALIRLTAIKHYLIVVMHHIISDAWSNRIIIDEFATCYRAHLAGQQPQLSQMMVQYADFAIWQRNWLDAGEKERQVSYWRKQLGAMHPVLQLPSDFPRLSLGNYTAAHYDFQLPDWMAVDLRKWVQDRNVTLFMATLCGFQMLLHRYSGQNDIRVGIPTANRHYAGVENIVGLFVNTQVLRINIDNRATLIDLMELTRDVALGAQAHQDLPFEQLVEALQPERNLNQNPLFQVMFNYMREDYRMLMQLPGLTVREYQLDEQGAQFELMLDIVEKPNGVISARFTYAIELFKPASIERMGKLYLSLLNDLLQNPRRTIGEVSLVTVEEWQQLKEWGICERRNDIIEPVHTWIEAQAKERPDAIALVMADTQLSYEELNRRANRLAHRLIALGIKPENRVGIAVERSIDMIVALLAILKAGGAYVPLDPDYPRDRLNFMMADSGIDLLLTHRITGERIPDLDGCERLELDALDLSNYPETNPNVMIHGGNLAYIIYTSGSTGEPKGIGVAHFSLGAHIKAAIDLFGLSSSDRVLLFSTINFDAFIDQLFPALCRGASIVLRDATVWDSETFYRQVITQQITVADLTTSYWQMLIGDFAKQGVRQYGTLRQISVGGESLPAAALKTWHDAGLGFVKLLNAYGPTEATVTATIADCSDSRNAYSEIMPVSIGKPLPGRNIYLLDSNLMPVAPGMPGELCIGGELLARGYVNRPGLTAQRFIADPFSEAGGRLYRTGDLARWREDGQIEYLGRVDHQVKVRGFRVELGEIEAQLLAQAEVREAVVLAKQGPAGARLVAYVSQQDGVDVAAGELRERLGKVLPDYMIPAAIVMMERLSLNANGKIDRNKLPEPEFAGTDGYEPPQGEVEQALAEIWQAVLGVERIGRHDNFFELGGDSILSLQIVTKARRAGWKITPRQLFERQTIAALEQVVEIDKLASNKENRYQAACLADYFDTEKIASLPIKSHDIVDIYPLSPTQEGMLFHTLEAPGTGLYINQVSVEVEGLDPARLVDAWQAMIDRHAALRTGFIWQAGMARPLQVVYKQAQARVTLLDWHGETSLKERIKALADEDLRSGFDFLNPPLARLSLIRIGENRHQLIWTKHHILLDGWGDSILTNDWLRKYNGEQLAPVGPEYGVYIQWLEKQDKLKLQHFWQTELKSLEGPTLLARSVNKQPIENSESDFAQIYTQLSIDETRQLQAFAQHMHVTLNTFVQAAWAILLHRYSGKQTVVFGTTVAGRPAGLPKADEMIGLFINTIPIPVERRSDLTVAKYLSILQQTNARLRDYEYTALADIQRWAGCSGQPLFDSIVVFENYPLDATIRENELGGLRFGEMDGKGLTGYAMDLQVTVENGLEIEYSYSCSDFTDQFVLDLRRYMELLMREMMVNPQRTIGELGWVDKNELNQLLKWRCEDSGAETFTRAYTPVHHLIERNASQRPDAIALLMGEQEMSYGKLNARANQLAHLLLQIGAGPEVRIGVAMERSLDIIVALLAILKTGSAYVPIDVDYPADRIAFMVRDSQVSLVLTQSTIQNKLKFDVSISTLAIDEAPLPDNAVENPDITVHEQNLAYIIYTSGSTGQPKGVAVTHGPLTMHCAATARIYGMNANSCELLFMSFSFDGAHERWLTALTVGAGLAIRSQELWTAEQTYDALHHYGITNAAFPPAYLGQVAEWAAPRNDPPPVELYVFGGEAMPKASYDLVCRTLRPRLLINGYGPTETVVTPLIWKTDAGSSFDCAYAPIGRPVGERTVYVLDVDMQPVPIGVVGELYIGGYGLARGYLRRPGLTAERFVADPFDQKGGRLYRTGDLVRWMHDGNIEYIGRSDQQVKIRGFRIELGEIEARIREVPGVADAALIVHEGASGAQLAAYIVATIKQSETEFLSNIKQALGKCLPDYMMPAHFVILPTLPRLSSGKLDLKSLPEPDATVTDSHYQEPSTLEAKALAAIWQEVLGIERVGETDNFFALGGDSLSSLKVMARIRNLTEVKLDFKLRDLIQRPTIASLLGLDSAPRSHLNNLLALNRFDKHSGIKTLFCVHAGLGTVFDYQPLARSLQDVCGVYGIPCRMLSDPAFQDTSLHQMAEDYCAMIQLKQPEGPYHVLGWSLGGSLAALIAALLEEKGYQVAFLGLIDPYIPGTEVSEVDDWRQDLIDFVSVAITDNASLTVEMLLSRKVPLIESKHAINAVLQEALSVTPIQKYPNILNLNQGYAEMGVEELTNIFMVARRLKALSLQTKTLKPLKVQSTCWWASDRDRADQHTLMAQIRSAYRDSMIIDTDHFGIVRADPLLKAIKTLLHRAIPDSGSDQALSLPDNYAG